MQNAAIEKIVQKNGTCSILYLPKNWPHLVNTLKPLSLFKFPT